MVFAIQYLRQEKQTTGLSVTVFHPIKLLLLFNNIKPENVKYVQQQSRDLQYNGRICVSDNFFFSGGGGGGRFHGTLHWQVKRI